VRLLGEELLAFKDSQGASASSTTSAPTAVRPLVFARNEDCGLRCVLPRLEVRHRRKVLDMPANRPTRG